MINHVLPGDSVATEFRKTGIEGSTIVCREAFIAGPIDADDLDAFWAERAQFVLAEYAEDEIEYHEKVADQLASLTDLTDEDEVNLWFEYELFCSVNMWFCLSLLKGTGAAISRVEPIGLEEDKRWDGFGQFEADDLRACFEMKTRLTDKDVELGASLWQAYRHNENARLTELAKTDTLAFPHLREVAAAAAVQDIQPLEVVRAITAGGETDFGKIFAEFRKRAGVYGYGDLQVQALIEKA